MCLQEPLPPYVGKPSAPQVFRGDALVKSFTRPSELHRHQWMASLGRESGQPISIWVREYDEGRICKAASLFKLPALLDIFVHFDWQQMTWKLRAAGPPPR